MPPRRTRYILLLDLRSSPVLTKYQIYGTPDAIAILKHFGLEDHSQALLAVDGVYRTWNRLSLQKSLDISFGRLDVWFEGTAEVHHSVTFY